MFLRAEQIWGCTALGQELQEGGTRGDGRGAGGRTCLFERYALLAMHLIRAARHRGPQLAAECHRERRASFTGRLLRRARGTSKSHDSQPVQLKATHLHAIQSNGCAGGKWCKKQIYSTRRGREGGATWLSSQTGLHAVCQQPNRMHAQSLDFSGRQKQSVVVKITQIRPRVSIYKLLPAPSLHLRGMGTGPQIENVLLSAVVFRVQDGIDTICRTEITSQSSISVC